MYGIMRNFDASLEAHVSCCVWLFKILNTVVRELQSDIAIRIYGV